MPLYEMCLILRPMPKKEIVDCLKRTAELIWKDNGVLKKIEYLGYSKLPYEATGVEEFERYKEGNYFLYHLSMGPGKIINLRPEIKLDMDIIKAKYVIADESLVPKDYECTLDEELLPPFYRESVQPLLENKNVRAHRRR